MKKSFVNWSPKAPEIQTFGKILAAIVVGLSVGTLLPPEPVMLPVIGSVSGVVAGSTGLVIGTVLFLQMRRSSSGCGCSGDCECS